MRLLLETLIDQSPTVLKAIHQITKVSQLKQTRKELQTAEGKIHWGNIPQEQGTRTVDRNNTAKLKTNNQPSKLLAIHPDTQKSLLPALLDHAAGPVRCAVLAHFVSTENR